MPRKSHRRFQTASRLVGRGPFTPESFQFSVSLAQFGGSSVHPGHNETLVGISFHQVVDVSLSVVEKIGWSIGETLFDDVTNRGVNVHLVGCGFVDVFVVYDTRQSFPVHRLAVEVALAPEDEVLLAAFALQERL